MTHNRHRVFISAVIRCQLTAALLACLPLKMPFADSFIAAAWANPAPDFSSSPVSTSPPTEPPTEDQSRKSGPGQTGVKISSPPENPQTAVPQKPGTKSAPSTEPGPGAKPGSEAGAPPENKQDGPEGEPRTDQKDAGEGEGEPKPETTIVDVLHAGISRSIQGTATWMDSFFGDRRYLTELNRSYIRFRYNVFLEDRTGLTRKPELQFRIVLPQLREKTHLVFAGSPREGSAFSAIESNSQNDQITPNEERNISAAVHQTLRETARDNIILRSGFQFHDRKPAIMLGPRYRILFPIDSWNLRFVEEILGRSNVGWEAKSTVDLERPLPNGLFFRATNDWSWKARVDGYTYAFIFYLGQPINSQRGLEYEWVNVFQTKPINELTEIALRARYRQQFWREWFFFEISPQLRFPRDREFRTMPGILFRIDMIFGNYR